MRGSGPRDPGSNPGGAMIQFLNTELFILLMARRLVDRIKEMSPGERGQFLLDLQRKQRERVLKSMKNDELLQVMHYLDPDEITDILQSVSSLRRKYLLSKLNKEMKEKVEYLLRFDPRTAAGLMNLNYVIVRDNATFNDVAKDLRKHEKRTGRMPEVLVIDKKGKFLGELPGYALALHKGNEKVVKHVKKLPTLRYDVKESDVIKAFKKHKHGKLVVLDDDGSVMGVIYSDDILRIINKVVSKSIYNFAGVSEEEDALDPFTTKVRYRYKWLIINLLTAFLAASVVAAFRHTISALVLLAVYMPIVAGEGGNAATQTLAVMVRGLALGEIKPNTAKRVILHEALAGVINGIITGSIVAAVALLVNKSPLIGLAVGLAMIINLFIAGVFGAIIPLIMKKLGKDPATSATIFITTATDVFGFLSFLGIATLLLNL